MAEVPHPDEPSGMDWTHSTQQHPTLPGNRNINKLHNLLAIHLEGQISYDQLEKVKFLFHDTIPEGLNTFLKIWKALESSGKVKVGDYTELKDVFKDIRDFCLVGIIEYYEDKMRTAGEAYDSWYKREAMVINSEVEARRLRDAFEPLIRGDTSGGVLLKNAAFRWIKGETGGTVRLPDGGPVVDIPAKAIPEDKIIWAVRPLNMQPLQPVVQDDICKYAVEDIEYHDRIVKYTLPVFLGPRSDFGKIPVGLTLKCPGLQRNVALTRSLVVYRKDADCRWEPVGSSFPYTEGNKLQVSLTSFSSFVLGIPESPSPPLLHIHIMVEKRPVRDKCEDPASSGNQVNVYITLNDYNFLEEFVLHQKINVARESCLFVNPNSDLKLSWKRKASLISAEPSPVTSSHVTLHKCYIQSLAEQPILVKFTPLVRLQSYQESGNEDDDGDELLILEQDDEQLMEFPVNKKKPITLKKTPITSAKKPMISPEESSMTKEKADDINGTAGNIKGKVDDIQEKADGIKGKANDTNGRAVGIERKADGIEGKADGINGTADGTSRTLFTYSPLAQIRKMRMIPVIYEQKRKLIKVDLNSIESLTSDISRRFGITDEIQLFGKRSQNKEYFVIEEDEDLEGLENMDGLVLLAKTASETGTFEANVGLPGPTQSFPDERPPEYAESMASQDSWDSRPSYSGYQAHKCSPPSDEAGETSFSITVNFGSKTKKIRVNKNSFDEIHSRIANRFQHTGDFKLQVRDASGDMVDIDDDEDIADSWESIGNIWAVDVEDLVEVSGKTYSLRQPPKSTDSPIIQKAIRELHGYVPTRRLLRNVDLTGDCLRLAYYGVVGKRNLQLQIQSLQFSVTKICQDVDVCLIKFEKICQDIVSDLECAFHYILDDCEDFALDNFSLVTKRCNVMLEESKRMSEDVEKEVAAAKSAMKDLLVKKQGGSRKDLEDKEKLDYWVKRTIPRINQLEIDEKEKREVIGERRQQEQTFRSEEGNATKNVGTIRHTLLKSLFSDDYKGTEALAQHKGKMAEQEREDHERCRELKELLQKKKSAMDELVLFSHQQLSRLDLASDETTKEALHAAQIGLKALNMNLQALSGFMNTTHEYCSTILLKQFVHNVGRAMRTEEERRNRYLRKDGFKQSVMLLYASFVGMAKIFREFHSGKGPVQRERRHGILENPTAEEAKAAIGEIKEDFDKKVKETKKQLEEEDGLISF